MSSGLDSAPEAPKFIPNSFRRQNELFLPAVNPEKSGVCEQRKILEFIPPYIQNELIPQTAVYTPLPQESGAGVIAGGNSDFTQNDFQTNTPILKPSEAVNRVREKLVSQAILETQFGARGSFGRAPSIAPSAVNAPIAPYSGIAAKGKPRMQRYREDWNNDTSLLHEVQNAVAGVERRMDEEAIAWTMRREGFGYSLMGKPAVTVPIAPGVTFTGSRDSVRQAPEMPTKRELQRRLSKRQRQIVRAFELWQAGLKWDEIAGAMRVPRAMMRTWRNEIAKLVGEYELARTKDAPRDPDTKRFARVVGRQRVIEKSFEPA